MTPVPDSATAVCRRVSVSKYGLEPRTSTDISRAPRLPNQAEVAGVRALVTTDCEVRHVEFEHCAGGG